MVELDWREFVREKQMMFGRKVDYVDPYRMEGVCPACKKSDTLFLVNNIKVCPYCYEGFVFSDMPHVAQGYREWGGVLNCRLCGRVMNQFFTILEGYMCLCCKWKKLGGHKNALKIEGSKW